jgi:hypothetical protein
MITSSRCPVDHIIISIIIIHRLVLIFRHYIIYYYQSWLHITSFNIMLFLPARVYLIAALSGKFNPEVYVIDTMIHLNLLC